MFARVAKLVDAPGLGPDGSNTVGVRVPPRAPLFLSIDSAGRPCGHVALR